MGQGRLGTGTTPGIHQGRSCFSSFSGFSSQSGHVGGLKAGLGWEPICGNGAAGWWLGEPCHAMLLEAPTAQSP